MGELEKNVVQWGEGVKDALQRRINSSRKSSVDESLKGYCDALIQTVIRITLEDLEEAQKLDLGNLLIEIVKLEVGFVVFHHYQVSMIQYEIKREDCDSSMIAVFVSYLE